eukprot:g3577.t1
MFRRSLSAQGKRCWGTMKKKRGFAAATSAKDIFDVQVTEDGIAVIRMDDPDASVNTLNRAFQDQVKGVIDRVQSDNAVRAAVIISGKKSNFIAGADIKMIESCTSKEEVMDIVREGHRMMNQLEGGKPIVAAINGQCLGGGLEVALACTYRIASTGPKTVLALPEVQLGLLPGAGGTQRLPKLVGVQKALPLITTGKNVRPAQAKRMGLVDQLADPHALESAAMQAARGLADGTVKPKRKKQSWMDWAIEGNSLGRKVLFKKAREMMMKASGGHYPAPAKIIDLVEKGCESGFKSYDEEMAGFADLVVSKESKALRSIFFAVTDLKKNRFGEPAKRAETVGVLGAGLMGAGIAEVSVTKGMKVLLKDLNAGGLARGEKQIGDNLAKKVKRRAMLKFERDRTMGNVIGLTQDMESWPRHFAGADLVVEAVLEDLKLKHAVIRETEQFIPEHCVFATNTSALPIADIAAASKRPENVIGMHYFSPVDKMPLLEIIRHEGTSDNTAAVAVDVGLRQGKTCIVVKDVPGFYVNRSLGPYMSEVMDLVMEGADPLRVDSALKSFGFPVGPINLADEVGIDVAGHVQEFLGENLGVRMSSPHANASKILPTFMEKGLLGKKSGKGFFEYDAKGKRKGINAEAKKIVEEIRAGTATRELSDKEIQERMVFRLINEAVFCLQDEIIANPTDGDIGLMFGIGYPFFQGGPFRYLDGELGIETFVSKMQNYAEKYGPQFEPAPLVVDMAKSGKKFHS